MSSLSASLYPHLAHDAIAISFEDETVCFLSNDVPDMIFRIHAPYVHPLDRASGMDPRDVGVQPGHRAHLSWTLPRGAFRRPSMPTVSSSFWA